MKNSILILSFLLLLAAVQVFSADEAVKNWNDSETAESLGLVPLEMPEGFYPLFPWGGFGDSPEILRTIADCGFNVSDFVGPDAVPAAEELGLKTFLQLSLPFREPEMPIEEYNALIAEKIASTKDDPNLLGYYVIDEPGAGKFPALAEIHAAIKKAAPDKLVYINLFPGYASTIGADRDSQLQTYSFTEYLERYVQEVKPQFLSYDNYMVEYSEDMTNKSRAAQYWGDMLEVRRIAMKYGLPWWNIISCLSIMKESSPPTPARFAYQAYTSLAAGCSSLAWFYYVPHIWCYAPVDADGRPTLTWLYLRAINEQIKTVGSYLTRFESTQVWFTEPTPSEGLPTNPNTLVKDLKLSWSPQADPGAITETPQLMVGEFKAKNGDAEGVMLVNLSFGRSLKVEMETTRPFGKISALNPIDGTLDDTEPVNGWWILPGHGTFFLLEK